VACYLVKPMGLDEMEEISAVLREMLLAMEL